MNCELKYELWMNVLHSGANIAKIPTKFTISTLPSVWTSASVSVGTILTGGTIKTRETAALVDICIKESYRTGFYKSQVMLKLHSNLSRLFITDAQGRDSGLFSSLGSTKLMKFSGNTSL